VSESILFTQCGLILFGFTHIQNNSGESVNTFEGDNIGY
jgi:hypothetical protein